MYPYRIGTYIRPKRITNTQFEGYILYYNHRYQLKENMVKVSSSTEFPQSPDAPEDGKIYITANYGVIDNQMSVTLGYVDYLEKDDHGLKFIFTVTNQDNLELFAERYLSGSLDVKILSKFENIVVDKNIVKIWPIDQIFVMNIPFSPELN